MDEETTVAEDEPRVLGKADLVGRERSTLRRELVHFPELKGSLWVWQLSWQDRLIVDEQSRNADGERDTQKWYACVVSMAVRESGEDMAQQLWTAEVSPAHVKGIANLGAETVERIVATSLGLSGAQQKVEEAVEKLAGFTAEAAEQTASCLARLCSVSGASEGCPVKSCRTRTSESCSTPSELTEP